MSNVTVQRLDGTAQLDNDPHRLDYIRQDQKVPIYRNHTSGNDMRSYGMVGLLFFGLLAAVLWLLKVATCWGATASTTPVACTVLSVASLSWTVGVPLLVLVSWCVLLYGKLQKDRSEALSNRIVRDRYSNPVDALMVASPDWNAPAYFASAQQAEERMAPFKQLPAGLDSLSMSSPAATKSGGAGGDDTISIVPIPISEWLQWLDERPHLLLAAETGGGKTTTTKAVLARRIFQGEDLYIIDPHSSHWMGITGIGGGEDWQAVTAALDAVEAEYRQRLKAREEHLERTGEELPVSHWTRLTVLLDEANNTQTNLDTAPRGQITPWKRFVKTLGSGARKVNISIILLCQSAVLEDLNISGPMRQNFTRIALDDRTVKQMIKDDEMDRSRKQALYAALEGRAYPATMVRGSQVYLLDRTGLDQVRLPSPDDARARLWTPPRCTRRASVSTLELLRRARKAGWTREQARAACQQSGRAFDNALWTQAGE